MLILLASGEAQAFDMRETAPMKASEVLRFASIIMFFMVLNFTEIIHLKSYMHLVLHMRHAIAFIELISSGATIPLVVPFSIQTIRGKCMVT
jgi:hypothetical protein